MRIVLDTNIMVSGLMQAGGPSGLLLRAFRRRVFTLVTSQAQIDELTRVLDYPRIQKAIDTAQAIRFVQGLPLTAAMADALPVVDFSADPADNVILATAIAGQAEWIVTGDKRHLLGLKDVQGIPILTAREAVERLGLVGE